MSDKVIFSNLEKLTDVELSNSLFSMQKKFFFLKYKVKNSVDVRDKSVIRKMRRDLARLNTKLSQKKILLGK